MEELSNEQLITVFGKGFEDLKASSLQQYKSLEKIQAVLDKRFSLDDDRYKIQRAEDARKERKESEPKQIEFSRKAQKQLQSLDQSEKYSAILKEIKLSQKKESGSIFKFLSPILLLLGGVAGLAFGVEKIPVVKKLFEQFKQGSVMSSLKNLTSVFNKKGLEFKEFIRSIPFVGRLIDAFDGFRLIARGDVSKGLKYLAFAIPGAEFIAQFFGTTKQRLLQDYDMGGDKSKKFSMFGIDFTMEQLFQNLTKGLEGAFIGITDFFEKIGKIFVQLYQVAVKGSGINFDDVIGLLNQIEVYFPSVSKITGFIKMLTEKAFVWQAGKDTSKEIKDINLGDIFNSVFTEISESINNVISTIVDIGNAISLIFSKDTAAASKGFAILDKYAPGLSDGLRAAREIMDDIYLISSADGPINTLKAIYKAFTGPNKYSKPAALDRKEGLDYEDSESYSMQYKESQEEEKRLKKKIKEEKDPNKKVLTDTLKGGTYGTAAGSVVGLATSAIPGTPFFGQPLTASVLYGIVTGVLSSAGTFIMSGSREIYKDMFGSDKDRSKRIESLEKSVELQQQTRKAINEAGSQQIDNDFFKLNEAKPVENKMDDVKKKDDQANIQQKMLKELEDVKELFAKQLRFYESMFKMDQVLNKNLEAFMVSSTSSKAPTIISNNSRNFVLTDKTVSNFEYRADLVNA